MSFTPNLAFDLQTHLGNAGTWDTPLNSNFTALDAVLGGVYTKSVTGIGAATTFTSANCYNNVIRFSGTLAQTLTVTFTTTVVKPWVFENTSTPVAGTVIRISMGIGNSICLPPGACQAYWDGSNMNFLNMGQVGGYLDLATTNEPAWNNACTVRPYLYCDGSTFSAVTYPVLNTLLGGNTLPDFRGRSRFFFDSSVGRITAAGSGINGNVFGAAGGSQATTILQGHLPSYNLTVTDPGHAHFFGAGSTLAGAAATVPEGGQGSAFTTNVATTNITVNSAGSGNSFGIMPPACVGGITLIRAM